MCEKSEAQQAWEEAEQQYEAKLEALGLKLPFHITPDDSRWEAVQAARSELDADLDAVRDMLGEARVEFETHMRLLGWSPAEAKQSNPPAESDRTGSSELNGDDAYLTTRRLADRYRLPREALRKRLERWRGKHKGSSGWIEDPERAGQEARFLYKLGDIRHLIDEMRD